VDKDVDTVLDRVVVWLVLSLPLHDAAARSTVLPSFTGMACMNTPAKRSRENRTKVNAVRIHPKK
jgi:hypothetical protein